MKLLIFALLLGLDNLTVCMGLGGLDLDRRRRWLLIGAFALAEGGLPLLGWFLGVSLGIGAALGGWVLLAAGVLMLAGCFWSPRLIALVKAPAALLVLPLALGLDNLAAGTGLAAFGVPAAAALALGLLSAGACRLGLLLGRKLALPLGERTPLVCGSWLVALALISLSLEVFYG